VLGQNRLAATALGPVACHAWSAEKAGWATAWQPGPATEAARSWARAPRLSGGCAGQGERRRGGGAAWCGGVLRCPRRREGRQ
jgi:hypothetical protein